MSVKVTCPLKGCEETFWTSDGKTIEFITTNTGIQANMVICKRCAGLVSYGAVKGISFDFTTQEHAPVFAPPAVPR